MAQDDFEDPRTVALDPRLLEAIWSKFRRDTGKTVLDDLLAHLRERGAIAPGALPTLTADTLSTVVLPGGTSATDAPTAEASIDILGALFAVFHRKTGRQDLADFHAYLRREGLTDDEASAPDEPSAETDPVEYAHKEEADRYEVSDLVGQGGMSDVHMARDRSLRRRVAMKLLKTELRRPPYVTQFRNEAQLTAQLDHPNVTPVYDLAVAPDGGISFSMKLIEGKTLAVLMAECRQACDGSPDEPLDAEHSLTTLLEHFLKICDAMAYAHSKGVIHCDLKPANVMVGRFHEVYVMDWGLAQLAPDGPDDARDKVDLGDRTGEAELGPGDTGISGTLQYMSPEQAAGRNDQLDARSDVYSLGLILFELVALRPALEGASFSDMLAKASEGRLTPLTHHKPSVRIAAELRAIIAKATALQPADRYPGADALADDVRRHMLGQEVSARPDNRLQRLHRWMAHHRTLTLALVLAIVAASAVATSWSLYRQVTAARAARLRERRLTAYLSQVAARSHHIDQYFLHLQTMLEGLAAATAAALAEATPSDEPLYSHTAYLARDAAPPDAVESPLYQRLVSVDWPVYKLAPGVALADVEAKLKRMIRLRHYYKQMLRDSQLPGAPPADEAGLRRRLLERGVPIRWAYIGLAEGVMFSYPGKGPYPDEYDPRVRPWYKLGVGKRQPTWGNPYIDLQGQGLILPCVVSIHDVAGRFAGVAGVEVTFDDIIKLFMIAPHERYQVLGTALVDDRGRVVVSSDQFGEHYEPGKLHKALDLTPYPDPSVVAAVRRKASGHLEGREGGRDILLVYDRTLTLGWTYIEKADLRRILRAGSDL